ncbi:LuxR family transcriptional regulator [Paenibacillus swuensis]|uniref:LuxR family transcriptional regulator n=1 Tax=Paenibacillus swuensis TaxID=1178515 RepID=A0A172TFL8_9BACL|nr:GIY-YIG nuclease family protein [Paenibacillus swuensis]ANE45752.1 LuxR family transcriptional regulator [Paenibacillus swuensis]
MKTTRRAELQQQYKEMKTEAGVYGIRHRASGRLFVASTRNLRSLNGVKLQLSLGVHMNKALQADIKAHGEEAFDIEVLETLEKKPDPFWDEKDALKKLEEKWVTELQPYGERGYHEMKA